jgi:FHS family glucose/mannose:H+ symporter-like MFS transporter
MSVSAPVVSRRRLTLAGLLSLASFAASINLVFAALVRMGDEFGVRPELLASISSIYFVAFFIVSMASGFISDRFGAKAPLLFGNLMTLVGGLIFASAHSAAPFVLGAIAMGMGGGATEGMCTALLARIFPGRERLVVGVSQAGYCFGAIVGPFVMGIFLPLGVSWRVFFIPVAALALLNFLLFATSHFPENEHEKRARRGEGETRRRGDAERKAAEVVGAIDTINDTTIKPRGEPGVLRRPGVLRWCIVIFLYVMAETALVSFVNIYLFEYRGAPERAAIQAISWFWAVMLVGRLLCSILPPTLADRKLIVGTMATGAAAVTLTIPMPGWPGVLAALLLASFLMAGAWPTIVSKTARDNADRASTVVGITVAAGSLGCIVAPPVMGLMFGSVPPTLAMAAPALPLLVGAALAAFSGTTRRKAVRLDVAVTPARPAGAG